MTHLQMLFAKSLIDSSMIFFAGLCVGALCMFWFLVSTTPTNRDH